MSMGSRDDIVHLLGDESVKQAQSSSRLAGRSWASSLFVVIIRPQPGPWIWLLTIRSGVGYLKYRDRATRQGPHSRIEPHFPVGEVREGWMCSDMIAASD